MEQAAIVIPAKGLPSKHYFDGARKPESPFFMLEGKEIPAFAGMTGL
jgi:hypothetical protein